jgi:hypothetical protein
MRKLFDTDKDPFDDLEGYAESCQDEQDGHRHIGCSVSFFRKAVAATGGERLAVALYLYRLRIVRRSKTVTAANRWLERELGIGRNTKYRAIADLEAAGIIRTRRKGKEATVVEFLV